jgi:hypothetical protein
MKEIATWIKCVVFCVSSLILVCFTVMMLASPSNLPDSFLLSVVVLMFFSWMTRPILTD